MKVRYLPLPWSFQKVFDVRTEFTEYSLFNQLLFSVVRRTLLLSLLELRLLLYNRVDGNLQI